MNSDFNFEKALKELETTVSSLEKGDMPLEESIKLFEKGLELSKDCSDYLNAAKQKITTLTEHTNGEKE